MHRPFMSVCLGTVACIKTHGGSNSLLRQKLEFISIGVLDYQRTEVRVCQLQNKGNLASHDW